MTQNLELAFAAVDFRSIRTVQICEHQTIIVSLDLEVTAAHSFVIKLNRISFFATNRERRLQSLKTLPRSAPCRILMVTPDMSMTF